MGIRRHNVIAGAMQVSCRCLRAALFFGCFAVLPPGSASAAEPIVDLGYGPPSQTEIREAREQRRKLAHARVRELTGGEAAPEIDAARASPAVSPPVLAPLSPPPLPLRRPASARFPASSPVSPPEPIPLTTAVSLPPPPPVDAPWREVSGAEQPPTEEAASPPLLREGVVSDRKFVLNPLEKPFPPVAEEAPPRVMTPEVPPVAGAQLVPEVAAALAETEASSLSPETERILDALPAEIIGTRKPETLPGNVSLDRVDPATALPKAEEGKETVSASRSLGMDVAVKQRPVDVDYELEKAYLALVGGNPEEAISLYASVLDIDPNSVPALFGLATTYHRVGLLDEARPVYGKLLKLDPKNKDAINNFLVLVGEEAPARALEHMRYLERQNPEFSPIPAQMALLYSKLGDMPEAIRSMQRAVNISPENLVYKYNLAILCDKAQKPVEAAILYRQLLEARYRGEKIPADADQIQQRLTFLLSNKG